MSASSKNCGSCGHPNTVDAMFCSKCGGRLPPRDAAPSTEPAEPPSDTVTSAPRRRVKGAAKTMLGVAAEPPAEASPAPNEDEHEEEEAAPVEPVEPKSAPARRIAGSARTMLGMPAPDAELVRQAVKQAKADAAARNASSTDRGLGPAAAHAVADAAHAEPASDAPAAQGGAADAPRARAASLGPTQRTMLGQPAPKASGDEPAPEPVRSSYPPEPGRRSSYPPGRGRAPVVYPSDSAEEDAVVLPKKKGPSAAMIVLVVGLVVLLVGGGALVYTLASSGSDLRASVVQGAAGEMIEIEVPGAAPGTQVRFHGSEQALEAGRVRFPLSADDLSLGDNELSVDVIAPDGSVTSETIDLHLDLRVRADLGPLASAPPAIDVVVEAPPGSQATLDGEALELDARGRGTRRYEIDGSDANAEGVVERVVRYRVVPPEGETAQGELRTHIPLTTMQIDRPGAEVVTDATSVEVAGAVAPGATVTVDGASVPVTSGRFLTTYPLPAPGEHDVEVVARAPGKAPRIARIHIRRVADLAAEAARFEVNRDLTYGRIAQNPATYRGQHVEFEGLVYNVVVRDGHSDIQILVSNCPGEQRCPLWVAYSAATTVEVQDRVRVLGSVAGEQQFRSQGGDIRTVPRVDATFVLPAAGRQ